MSKPWSKFYWSDWRSDPRLRMCGLAARGLWMEMLALMHEAEPYGHLLVFGNAPTDDELAVLAGAPPSQIPALLGELERVGVFSRTRKGVIYSRRMLRDEKKARTARENGQNGGNPNLGKTRTIPASDNPTDNHGDKPQKPEAIGQKDISSIDDDFREWYGGYPLKKAPDKALALYRAARKKPGVTRELLLTARDRYAAECVGKEKRFIKHPTTWLNGGCWDDEPASADVLPLRPRSKNPVIGSPEYIAAARAAGIDEPEPQAESA